MERQLGHLLLDGNLSVEWVSRNVDGTCNNTTTQLLPPASPSDMLIGGPIQLLAEQVTRWSSSTTWLVIGDHS